MVHMSAVKNTQIVDTVGAGDAFHGGLLYGLSRGMDLNDALQTAQKCASLNCSKFGAREGMPTLQELELYQTEQNIGGK
jgi:sugar/nucleoside kinase (ribokinase family)